jgi:hypothetical protein
MTDYYRPELQRDVQRLLGRCLLRLQQYERLMKVVLAHHALGGPVDELEAQRVARVEEVSDKSLGTLVKRLFESYVVAKGFELRISAIVDACFRLIADGVSAPSWTRGGCAQARCSMYLSRP